MIGTIAALLYVAGAASYWQKLDYHLAFLTLSKQKETKDDESSVELPASVRTLACSLWFVWVPLEMTGIIRVELEKVV